LQDKFYIVVVTNQSGVARGLLTEDDLMAIHLELVQRLAVEGVVLDALYYCPHLPEATVQAYQVECDCRKPKPGMLLQAKRDWGLDMAHSFMVGDSSRDIEAGCAAGVKCILLNDGGTALPSTYGLAPDLAGAVRLILAQSSS
jgi:D-glycero-D-manno-heptose 1,7-bisphosphate phosphatase